MVGASGPDWYAIPKCAGDAVWCARVLEAGDADRWTLFVGVDDTDCWILLVRAGRLLLTGCSIACLRAWSEKHLFSDDVLR